MSAIAVATHTEDTEPLCCDDGELAIALPLRCGHTVEVRLRWRWIGREHAPVVAVLGGISAHRTVATLDALAEPGWWQAQVGTGRALDPQRVRVLGIDWLGRDGDLDLPIDTADQADALAAVLDHLRIARLQALVGSSYGAMVGLSFAQRHPQRLAHLVAISGADRADPFAAAWRALQRQVLALGNESPAAIALARQLAMLSYRTAEEFAERFAAAPQWQDGRLRVAAQDYLDAAGARFAATFPAVAYRRLSESIDAHRVDASSITTPTDLVAVAEDRLVPVRDLQRLHAQLGGASRLQVIHALAGHDGFLTEPEQIAQALRTALANPPDTLPYPAGVAA